MPYPLLRWLFLALLLIASGSFQPALGCQCIGHPVQGFIHPEVSVLPANARGMLFHASARLELTPALFTVTSSSSASASKIRIDPVELPPGHPMRSRLPADGRLVRVGVEGGFIPNARYSVTYHPPEPYLNALHASVSFGIVPAPLDLSTAGFDGPARRTMLQMETRNGSCGTSEPALAQAFTVRVPHELQRYLPAFSLLSEASDSSLGATFTPLQYRPSLCTPPLFDRSALGVGRDLLYRDCRTAADRMHVRTWVGMLEVDEQLVLFEPVTVDLSAVRSMSCSPFGMLREAIERGDDGEVANLSCEIGRPAGLTLGSLDLETEPVPTLDQWNSLLHQPDPKVAACGQAAM
jgi:hypothetical protein